MTAQDIIRLYAHMYDYDIKILTKMVNKILKKELAETRQLPQIDRRTYPRGK